MKAKPILLMLSAILVVAGFCVIPATGNTLSNTQMLETRGGCGQQCAPVCICPQLACGEVKNESGQSVACGQAPGGTANGCLLGLPWQTCAPIGYHGDECTIMEFCSNGEGGCDLANKIYNCGCGHISRCWTTGCTGS